MAQEIVNGKQLTEKESEEQHRQQDPPTSQDQAQRREQEEHELVRQRAEALALRLAQTYEELTRLLERNPGMKREITEGEAREDKVYQKLKQKLKMADMAPRCRWVKQDGTSCRSPQMKQHIYCFAHRQMAEARTLLLMLPAMEDANAIQVGLMRIQKALIEESISTKKAGLLLYSMQLALTNVGQTTFGQAKDEEMVRYTVSEEQAVEEDMGPGIMEPRPEPVKWKPTPDMYRPEYRERMAAENQRPFTTERTAEMEEDRDMRTPPRAAAPQEHGSFSALRDERLPKGPHSASGSLEADSGTWPVESGQVHANLG